MLSRALCIRPVRPTTLSILRGNTLKSPKFSTISYVAENFETLHEASKLPWLILIPATTVLMRTFLTLPLSILQRKRLVKQNELRNIVSSISPVVKFRLAQTQKLTPEQITYLSMKETRKRQKKLFKKYNVDMWKNVLLPLVQIPLWVTISLGIRKLTDGSTTLIETNNIYNILDVSTDLSLALDSAPFLLPIVLGTVSLINVEYNGIMFNKRNFKGYDNTKLSKTTQSILTVSRLGSIFMMGVSSQASILLTVYWITSQVFSLIQNYILDTLWPLHNNDTNM
ncbi:hypothetical protein Kpol_472p13 [Vanderwaltozyma polyspora DSM 70294]|uniref:Mitochondrial inner membrane protein COX18 n=1 Tax=Vanderwaltozyma polyspora (strain ATCC 22028 / DSM 70294 / BCRC 21397 / CBS 2163 / NBRC 10782 / NRRL Y-8283 / UCD 57-17) TaxID=436907 RepID=A7TQI1_VANPO|nr:uncharacterized protein Kpol_472p13 [Vanderwaltozyma polyspora DSM 70294]EDO15482.1 hypothetical protein Kpol_472p13 [Vanderwaltozyma polyspora DSM 70294]